MYDEYREVTDDEISNWNEANDHADGGMTDREHMAERVDEAVEKLAAIIRGVFPEAVTCLIDVEAYKIRAVLSPNFVEYSHYHPLNLARLKSIGVDLDAMHEAAGEHVDLIVSADQHDVSAGNILLDLPAAK